MRLQHSVGKSFIMGRRIDLPYCRVQPQFFVTLAVAFLLIPLPWMIAWMIACIIHESGHYIAIRIAGKRIYSLTITGRGILMDTEPLGNLEWFCALAGPVAGLGFLAFYRRLPRIAICCLTQSAFNFLPLCALDGEHVLAGLLQLVFTNKTVQICMRVVSAVFGMLLICLCMMIVRRTGAGVVIIVMLILLVRRLGERKSSCKDGRLWVQ